MDESMTDEVEDGFDGEDDEAENSISENYMKTAITGRGVTLQMLITDGIIEPGNGLLTLKYLGRKFLADLLPNGKIMTPATKEMFSTPSAWAAHCKRQVNPNKKSGCGWNSVMYKGRKLDTWKTSWFRKHRPGSPARKDSASPRVFMTDFNQNNDRPGSAASLLSNYSDHPKKTDVCHPGRDLSKDQKEQIFESKQNGHDSTNNAIPHVMDLSTKHPLNNGASPNHKTSSDCSQTDIQEEGWYSGARALNLSMKEPDKSCKSGNQGRESVHHSILGKRNQNLEPGTFVSCETFKSLGKTQPFTVSLSTNVLLLLDFHCHLTSSEVVGYLGGTWNTKTQHLSIIEAFPCRCKLTDGHKSTPVEDQIKNSMQKQGLSLVGWYHSHPFSQSDPTIRDIGCQMSYQLCMKGSGASYYPCVGVISSPYFREQRDIDSYNMFMVMPPIEDDQTDSCGIPMKVSYSLKQNSSLTEELLSEMKKLRDFYSGSADWINFNHSWQNSIRYIEKLKESLSNKLPSDQMDGGTLLDFVEHLVLNS